MYTLYKSFIEITKKSLIHRNISTFLLSHSSSIFGTICVYGSLVFCFFLTILKALPFSAQWRKGKEERELQYNDDFYLVLSHIGLIYLYTHTYRSPTPTPYFHALAVTSATLKSATLLSLSAVCLYTEAVTGFSQSKYI